MTFVVYPSNTFDYSKQRAFLNGLHLRYNHLDWRDEKSWLEEPFAYTLINNNEIIAMLSCSPETTKATWIRYFVCERNAHYPSCFTDLLNIALRDLKQAGILNLFALGMPEWFSRLLANNGFRVHSQIITLKLLATKHKALPVPLTQADSPYTFRRMTEKDLTAAYNTDTRAFSPEWQLGALNLKSCFMGSEDSYVAEYNQEVIAYLISERFFTNQHISRLAVHPEHQGKHIGTSLINATIEEALLMGVEQFSVNTNSQNQQGIRTYQKLGFAISDNSIPVYTVSLLD